MRIWDHNRVLAVGEPRLDYRIYRDLSPAMNCHVERVRWALLEPALRLVPRSLRTRKRLRQHYWQPKSVAAIQARAEWLEDRRAERGGVA